MQSIEERYISKFKESGKIFRNGINSIPGGGHQSRIVKPHPVYVDEAKGSLKWDADGNELIDYMMGFGALILGNAHPAITESLTHRLKIGTHMGTLTQLEIKWAKLVQELIPSAERVRFTSSGTEATLLAIRMSRSYTGKTKLVKLREHFHGWNDYVAPGSGINTETGIPSETLGTVIVSEPEISKLKHIFEQDDNIAAIILEPTGGHWGQFPLPNPNFLHDVRELTTRHGIVMIMDEVVCGFRISLGGAQEKFNVRPDLSTLGKILCGGLPGAAVAGRADIIELLSSTSNRRMVHPGTFNANPMSATAGITTLELLTKEPINERANAMASRLKQGIREALTKMEVSGHTHGIASIVHIALGVECNCPGEICTLPHDQLASSAASRAGSIKLAMLNEGIDMLGGIGFLVSATHQEDQIDQTVDAFERALGALRKDGIV